MEFIFRIIQFFKMYCFCWHAKAILNNSFQLPSSFVVIVKNLGHVLNLWHYYYAARAVMDEHYPMEPSGQLYGLLDLPQSFVTSSHSTTFHHYRHYSQRDDIIFIQLCDRMNCWWVTPSIGSDSRGTWKISKVVSGRFSSKKQLETSLNKIR